MSDPVQTAAERIAAKVGAKAKPSGNGKHPKKDRKPTQAEVLLKLAAAATYVHTPEGKAFALVQVGDGDARHTETLSLRTKAFRNWLSRELYRATKKAASAKIMQDVLGVLDARANYDGDERAVMMRVAEVGGALHLDLADARWRSLMIEASGWRLVTSASPLFRRPRGMMPLPQPVPGGDLDELREYVNLTDDGWYLTVPWMVQALRPRGPYPILCLHGEQGSAKSTTARAIRSLIDPNAAPLRSQPRDERDLVIAASNAWVIALDNLSHIEPWTSDALCRLSTGGGFGTRELYSDDEEVIFDAQRPIILTGIEDLASRADLLDRSLLGRLPRIEEEKRRTEADFWARFDAARPRMLGALLDAASGALRELPRVRLDRLPRMADFALLGVAVERALEWPDGSFLSAYGRSRGDASVAALESSMIFPALEEFVGELHGGAWNGTCQQLLNDLTRIAGDRSRSKYWPGSPRGLSGQLRRLAPSLRGAGIVITFGQSDGSNSRRSVRVERCEGESVGGQPSQQARQADPADGPGDCDGSPPIYSLDDFGRGVF